MLALLLTLSVAVQDSGAFVTRLGNDTLAMEQYTRTATQLKGEYVIRSPRSLHRIYAFDLNPDGTIRRLQLVTHAIGGGPGPAPEERVAPETEIRTAEAAGLQLIKREDVPPFMFLLVFGRK